MLPGYCFLGGPLGLLQVPLPSLLGWLGPAGVGVVAACEVGVVIVWVVCLDIVSTVISLREDIYLMRDYLENVFPGLCGLCDVSHLLILPLVGLDASVRPARGFPVLGNLGKGGQCCLVAAVVVCFGVVSDGLLDRLPQLQVCPLVAKV